MCKPINLLLLFPIELIMASSMEKTIYHRTNVHNLPDKASWRNHGRQSSSHCPGVHPCVTGSCHYCLLVEAVLLHRFCAAAAAAHSVNSTHCQTNFEPHTPRASIPQMIVCKNHHLDNITFMPTCISKIWHEFHHKHIHRKGVVTCNSKYLCISKIPTKLWPLSVKKTLHETYIPQMVLHSIWSVFSNWTLNRSAASSQEIERNDLVFTLRMSYQEHWKTVSISIFPVNLALSIVSTSWFRDFGLSGHRIQFTKTWVCCLYLLMLIFWIRRSKARVPRLWCLWNQNKELFKTLFFLCLLQSHLKKKEHDDEVIP